MLDQGVAGIPPGTTVNDVTVLADHPEWDLSIAIDLAVLGEITVQASATLNDAGNQITISFDMAGIAPIVVPFNVIDNLAGPPVLQKVPAAAGHDAAIAALANLDMRVSPQASAPLPAGQHVPRGDAASTVSFLPRGKAVAFGLGAATFSRFANNLWHTQLTAADGSQPFPEASNAYGTWNAATITTQPGRIRTQLTATVPIDSPIIDILPDADVTLTLDLVPRLSGGNLVFDIASDVDVDTGWLGTLFGSVVGGILGFILGGPVGAAVGAFSGIIAVEVAEAIVEGEARRQVVALTAGGPVPTSRLVCEQGIVQQATASTDDAGLSLSAIDAIPRSIPIAVDNPDPLHERHTVITSVYDDLSVDANGFAVAGEAEASTLFGPLPVTLVDARRSGGTTDEIQALVYQAPDGARFDVPLADVHTRIEEGEITSPIELGTAPSDPVLRIPAGTLATVCLTVDRIRRRRTIVTDIAFTSGVALKVPELVALQDRGALVVLHHQLIHPRNANPYYRSPPDSETGNNLEARPTF